jgi:hypothetical protein
MILRLLRLEVSLYKAYIANQFQTTFDQGEGGSKIRIRGDSEQQGGKLLSQLRLRIRPLDHEAESIEFPQSL